MRNRIPTALFLTIVLIIPLMLVPTETVYGGVNPPSGEEHLMGPAIIGEVTIIPYSVPEYPESILVSFSGTCQGQPVTPWEAVFEGVPFDTVTADTLQYFRQTGGAPPGPSDEVIVVAVTKFTKQTEPNDVIYAHVVILYVVGK